MVLHVVHNLPCITSCIGYFNSEKLCTLIQFTILMNKWFDETEASLEMLGAFMISTLAKHEPLPREKLIGCRDLLNCMLVCRRLRDLLKNSMLWTYQRELERDGLIDGFSTLTTLVKLEKLLDRRRRWRGFDPISVETISIPFSPGPCSLIGGVFARVVAGPSPGTSCVGVLELPSGDGPVQDVLVSSRSWTNIIALAIDPTQDLLVVLNRNLDPDSGFFLNFTTLFTQKSHPRARKPCLKMLSGLSGPEDFQLAGNLVAVQTPDELSVAVWNWQMGCLVWVCRNSSGFAFLSPSLWISINIHVPPEIRLELYYMDKSATCIAYLLLPPHRRENDEVFRLRREEICLEAPRLGGSSSTAPFITSPEKGLLLIGYPCERLLEGEICDELAFILVFKTSGIFRLLTEICIDPPPARDKIPLYPWSRWAQSEVAVLESDDPVVGFAERMHGQRIIFNEFDWNARHGAERHLTTVFDDSGAAAEGRPLGRPAPICTSAESEFLLDFEAPNPPIKRLKMNVKAIQAMGHFGDCFLDQNYILALQGNIHPHLEDDDEVPEPQLDAGPNRKLIKLWRMG
ncbi:hypothetical protein SISNIDRAFT_471596 [Sistotremastrum niveocremeum HHB9708]|uniref:Uncharacterized protein n=1 Tax=Sistotremastrum niveocremeum HHB9708 TaxID=1314777 RepID=A0A164MFN5_9AGAM|nr:hypothetical protein SISNIDRAFT_471596 [Sistotremastrum niveocremeum HHB9708]